MIYRRISGLFLLLAFLHLVLQNILLADGSTYSSKDVRSIFPVAAETEGETGHIAVVRLITRPRSRRDLSQNDYHILEIDIPSKKKNLKVHLMKTDAIVSPDLETYVLTENGTREKLSAAEDLPSDCLYTGSISGDSEGTVALSTCSSNPPGFVGIIKTGDEHLFIEPKVMESNSGTSETKNDEEIIHIVKTGEDIAPKDSYSDAIKVPKSDLEAAVSLMAKQLKKHNQDSENSNDDDESKNIIAQTMDLNGDSDNSVDGGIQLESFAKTAKSSSNTKVVELAVFCDSKFYGDYKKKFSKDAIKQMKAFILTLVNAMSLIYKQKSLGVDVQFRLVLLEIMKSDPRSLAVQEHAESYMKSFCQYTTALNTNLDSWDHAMIITGVDVHQDGNPLVTGLAYAGTMCLPNWSCSLSEATTFGCVYVLAHELGHSMGIDHDGTGASWACDSEKYIMSPTTGAGKTEWSSCSRDNLLEFLKTGNNIVGRTTYENIPSCLSKTSKGKSIKYSSSKMPGEKYDAKYQCQLAKGSSYFPYTTGSKYSDICNMLYCGRTEGMGVMVIGTHPALDGTACATGKKCRSGKCG